MLVTFDINEQRKFLVDAEGTILGQEGYLVKTITVSSSEGSGQLDSFLVIPSATASAAIAEALKHPHLLSSHVAATIPSHSQG